MLTPDSILAPLNDKQREAALSLRGPVVVRAGAGCGKTRTITHRIAYGVATGVYRPEHVVALSFTRKAAAEMQDRLNELGVPQVQSQTFHSLALSQLLQYWERTIQGAAPRILRSKGRLISQILDEMSIKHNPDIVQWLSGEIEWRKTTMRSLSSYVQALPERQLPDGLSADIVQQVQEKYEWLKFERKQVDFDDVLILMVGMMREEPVVAAEIRRNMRYFTVDEYQDVSPLQQALLLEWLGDRQDLCVVGDASQMIYSFTGATNRFLLDFARKHEGAKEIILDMNYRSNQKIVSLANTLIADEPGALLLLPHNTEHTEDKPRVYWFESAETEVGQIAFAVKAQIESGIPASKICVLARTAAQLHRLRDCLHSYSVPNRVLGENRIISVPEVKTLMVLLKQAGLVGDERAPEEILRDIFYEIGYRDEEPADMEKRETWLLLRAFHDEIEQKLRKAKNTRDATEEIFTNFTQGYEPSQELLTLSTIHQAKGLEWDCVYIMGLGEGMLPISYAETDAEIDEERRVLYVALTRARKELRLSGSPGGAGRGKPSRFIDEAGLSVQRFL